MMRCTRCRCTSNSLTYDNRRRLCRFSVSGQASEPSPVDLQRERRPVITRECEKGGPQFFADRGNC